MSSYIKNNFFTKKLSILLKKNFPKFLWKYFPITWGGNTESTSSGLNNLFSQKETIPESKLLASFNYFAERNISINTVFELGSGAGRNLFYLSKSFPEIKYTGFDINDSLIVGAKHYLEQNHKKLDLSLFSLDIEKANFEEYEMDIVFTSMLLMYINPKKISSCIANICQNTKKGLIIQEIEGKNDPLDPFAGYLHNYQEIFMDLGLTDLFEIKKEKINYIHWTTKYHQAYQYTLRRK